MKLENIRKRSDRSYTLDVSAGYDSKGKQIRKYRTVKLPDTVKTQKQIENWLIKQKVLFEEDVENGTHLDGSKITLATFIEKWWIEYALVQLSPSSLKNYRMRIDKRIIPALGHLKLAKIQPPHLLEFYNNLREDGIRLDGKFTLTALALETLAAYSTQKLVDLTGVSFKTIQRIKNGEQTRKDVAEKICNALKLKFKTHFTAANSEKKLSDKTIREHHNLVSSILSTALSWNLITSNPAERVDLGKVKKYKAKYYDEEQITALFKALSSEPFNKKCMVYLSVDTGIRESELAGLTWSDVDFTTRKVTVDKQRQYISGYGELVRNPKSESGNRTITLSVTVNNMLERLMRQQQAEFEAVGETWNTDTHIFTHEDGRRIHPAYPYRWFTAFLERHELPKITYHQLRHTNASLSIAAGVDVVTMSGRLGHADKNVTLGTYSHIIKSKEEQAANCMDEFYTDKAEVVTPKIRKAV